MKPTKLPDCPTPGRKKHSWYFGSCMNCGKPHKEHLAELKERARHYESTRRRKPAIGGIGMVMAMAVGCMGFISGCSKPKVEMPHVQIVLQMSADGTNWISVTNTLRTFLATNPPDMLRPIWVQSR
jgi:hypothetical protein